MKILIPLALLLAWTPVPEIAFDSTMLKVDKADMVDARDLNGDGKPDLVVFAGRTAKGFLFRAGAGIPPDPDWEIRFDADVFLWTFGTFADAKGPQLVTFSTRGIRRHLRKNDREWLPPEDVIIHANLLQGQALADAPPLPCAFMPDLDGDGLSDAIFFAPGELWMFPQRKDADGRPIFRLREKLPVPMDGNLLMAYGPHQRFRQTVSVPMLVTGDIDGDKRTDLLYYREDTVASFLQREGGAFADPDAAKVDIKKSRRGFLRLEAPPRIADFNNDGLLDLALPNMREGECTIYFNQQGKAAFTEPDRKLTVSGYCGGIYHKDLDGDGKLEIVMGALPKPGLLSGLDAFLSKKVTMQLHYYRIDASGNFAREPAQILDLRVPYTFSVTRDAQTIDLKFWPTVEADINGDGVKDLLVGTSDTTLSVYYGDKTTLITQDVAGTITMKCPEKTAVAKVDVADFNGDGKSDLILRYRVVEEKKTYVEVKMSK